MRTPRFLVPSLLAVVLAAPATLPVSAHAAEEKAAEATTSDVLELEDGTRLTGQVVGENDDFVSFRSGGVTRAYARSKVKTLTRNVAAAKPEAGKDGPAAGDGMGGDDEAPTAPKKAAKQAKREQRKAEKKTDKEMRGNGAPSADVLSAPAKAWLDELLLRADSTDPLVRRSVAGAMMQLGPAALPEVRRAEAGAEGPRKQVLGSVIRNLEGQAKRAANLRAKRNKDAAKRRQEAARRAAEGRFQALVKDLELSDAQVPKMRALLTKAVETRVALLKEAREKEMDVYAMDLEFTNARKTLSAEAAAFLDEGQLVLFEEHAYRLLRAPVKGSAKKGDKKKAKKKPAE